MSCIFDEKLADFFKSFGRSAKMILATSLNDAASARTVSVVVYENLFYFQTDRTFRKYAQLTANKNVALCSDNIQVEGVCAEKGRPSDAEDFCVEYAAAFPASFSAYTGLQNERLFVVTPLFIQKWVYEDGAPYLEQFDLTQKTYKKQAYKGE